MTTTLESSAESGGTSTVASRMMSMSVSAWRPRSTARASYQSPGSTGSWRTISRLGIVSFPVTSTRRTFARRPGSTCTVSAARLAALSTRASTFADANG